MKVSEVMSSASAGSPERKSAKRCTSGHVRRRATRSRAFARESSSSFVQAERDPEDTRDHQRLRPQGPRRARSALAQVAGIAGDGGEPRPEEKEAVADDEDQPRRRSHRPAVRLRDDRRREDDREKSEESAENETEVGRPADEMREQPRPSAAIAAKTSTGARWTRAVVASNPQAKYMTTDETSFPATISRGETGSDDGERERPVLALAEDVAQHEMEAGGDEDVRRQRQAERACRAVVDAGEPHGERAHRHVEQERPTQEREVLAREPGDGARVHATLLSPSRRRRSRRERPARAAPRRGARCRSATDDAPAVEDDDLVRERRHVLGEVRGEDDRRAVLPGDAGELLAQLVADPRIEPGRRLVEKQQARPPHEREQEKQTHRLAARQPFVRCSGRSSKRRSSVVARSSSHREDSERTRSRFQAIDLPP